MFAFISPFRYTETGNSRTAQGGRSVPNLPWHESMNRRAPGLVASSREKYTLAAHMDSFDRRSSRRSRSGPAIQRDSSVVPPARPDVDLRPMSLGRSAPERTPGYRSVESARRDRVPCRPGSRAPSARHARAVPLGSSAVMARLCFLPGTRTARIPGRPRNRGHEVCVARNRRYSRLQAGTEYLPVAGGWGWVGCEVIGGECFLLC